VVCTVARETKTTMQKYLFFVDGTSLMFVLDFHGEKVEQKTIPFSEQDAFLHKRAIFSHK
jgi:hypothetical protein